MGVFVRVSEAVAISSPVMMFPSVLYKKRNATSYIVLYSNSFLKVSSYESY
jgi:hypothetical protein